MYSTSDPTKMPATAPPQGHISQFDAPWNSLQHGVVISFSITFAISTSFLLLRSFQAVRLVKKLEMDLIIISISYSASIVYFATVLRLMRSGWGRHLWDVSMAQLAHFSQGALPSTMAYLICPAITKVAILSTLHRVNPSFIYRSVTIAIGVAILTYTILLCALTGGPCNPLHPESHTCLNNIALAHAVFNIASDLAIITLPIPTILGLSLSTKQKTTVGCMMTIGSGVVVCSVARLPYVVALQHPKDVTYTTAILGAWSVVEINLGIICACAMRLKPLVNFYLPRLKESWLSNPRTLVNPRDSSLHLDPRGDQQSFQLHEVRENQNHLNALHQGIHVNRAYDVCPEQRDVARGSTDEILPGRWG